MDYDTKYYNHKWEGFAENFFLNGKLIDGVRGLGLFPLGHLDEIDLIDVHFFS